MNEFFENLKREATANPLAAATVATALIAASGKFVEQIGHAKGSAAYARHINNKLKQQSRKK